MSERDHPLIRDGALELADAAGRLTLRQPGRGGSAVCVDFLAGPVGHRLRTAAATRQPIARAVGLKFAGGRSAGPEPRPEGRGRAAPCQAVPLHVLDATAGLAADAMLLAVLGCRVTAVERCAPIAVLVRDALRRAEGDRRLGPVIRERFELVVADAREVLAGLAEERRPEVIYLDPMFAARGKSAAASGQMRLCRLAAGDDADAAELLTIARCVATRRVVVKRPVRAEPLGGPPDVTFPGRSVRYDAYLQE